MLPFRCQHYQLKPLPEIQRLTIYSNLQIKSSLIIEEYFEMKIARTGLLIVIVLALCALGAVAKPGGCPKGPPPGPRPVPPLVVALDANADGTIDANEIANAPASLLTLDKNGDGVLTRDELRPGPPDGKGKGKGAGCKGPGGPGKCPLVAALDTNADGTIDANEIANASASLLKLDKNGDGVLTRDEYAPGCCGKGKPGK